MLLCYTFPTEIIACLVELRGIHDHFVCIRVLLDCADDRKEPFLHYDTLLIVLIEFGSRNELC